MGECVRVPGGAGWGLALPALLQGPVLPLSTRRAHPIQGKGAQLHRTAASQCRGVGGSGVASYFRLLSTLTMLLVPSLLVFVGWGLTGLEAGLGECLGGQRRRAYSELEDTCSFCWEREE